MRSAHRPWRHHADDVEAALAVGSARRAVHAKICLWTALVPASRTSIDRHCTLLASYSALRGQSKGCHHRSALSLSLSRFYRGRMGTSARSIEARVASRMGCQAPAQSPQPRAMRGESAHLRRCMRRYHPGWVCMRWGSGSVETIGLSLFIGHSCRLRAERDQAYAINTLTLYTDAASQRYPQALVMFRMMMFFEAISDV